MATVEEIEGLLGKIDGVVHVEVRDTTGTSDHFEAVVVAAAFAGKSLLERHRMVHAALGDRMKGDVHALSLRTHTPEEWKR